MFDECIYFNLSALTRKITKIWQTEFDRLNLSASQGYLLFAIVEQPKATQKDLSEMMELDASTITRFMDVLERRGFLEKTSRGKGASFAVTAEGKKAYRTIKKSMDSLYHSMQEHLGSQTFTDFVAGLRSARRTFEQETA